MANALFRLGRQKFLESLMDYPNYGPPNSLPPPVPSKFQFTEGGRQITVEEIITLCTALVRMLGGSVVLDGADIVVAQERNETIQLLTQNDPWQLIVKVVPREGNV